MERLKARQLTQYKLAVAMGKSVQTIGSWAAGRHLPKLTPSEMKNLCELLDCSLAELVEIFPEKKETPET